MLAGPFLALVLTVTNDAADPHPSRVRAELEACAERIEEMKAHSQRGAELDRLLRRAQELAAELERASADLPAPLRAVGPSPDELRERADAARDEADRLAAEIAALDVKIEDARRAHGDPDPGLRRAALGSAAASSSHRLHVLAAQRASLAAKRAQAEAEAARLEAEARDAER